MCGLGSSVLFGVFVVPSPSVCCSCGVVTAASHPHYQVNSWQIHINISQVISVFSHSCVPGAVCLFFSQVQQLVIHRAFLSVLCHVLIFSPFYFLRSLKSKTYLAQQWVQILILTAKADRQDQIKAKDKLSVPKMSVWPQRSAALTDLIWLLLMEKWIFEEKCNRISLNWLTVCVAVKDDDDVLFNVHVYFTNHHLTEKLFHNNLKLRFSESHFRAASRWTFTQLKSSSLSPDKTGINLLLSVRKFTAECKYVLIHTVLTTFTLNIQTF